MNPLVRLAANAAPHARRYILFAGAGVSKDAGLPSAWDVMMTTAELLRRADSGDPTVPIADWFLTSAYRDLSYADIMGRLFPEIRAQDDFLRSLLPPGAPGEAHQLIAELAVRGIIRAVITTNFDDRIERAIEQRGLPVQVLATEEDFQHAEPLIHAVGVRVYKPHGTLGRGRLRNSPADLAALPPTIADELLRAINDHGLIVQGCAGADAGILNIFRCRRRNLYPVFWLCLGAPSAAVLEAFDSDFVQVPSTSASASLRALLHISGELSAIAPDHRPAARLADLEKEITSGSAAAPPKISEFITELLSAFAVHVPDLNGADEPDEVLVQALDLVTDLVADHARLARTVAQSGRFDCIEALYNGFGPLLSLADENRHRRTHHRVLDGDFGKFVVLEMFVTFIGFLIQAARWDALATILKHDLYEEHLGTIGWMEISTYIQALDRLRNQRLNLQRCTVVGDLLEQRHSSGGKLHKVAPYDLMVAADVFLMLRAAFPHATVQEVIKTDQHWVPYTLAGTNRMPEFLGRAVSRAHAEPLARALGLANADDLREKVKIHRRVNAAALKDSFMSSPGDSQPELLEQIGTRP